MSVRTFVDSNILIYAYDVDAGAKRQIAKRLLEELWSEKTGVLSPQVLQEFYVNVTRKIGSPLPKAVARAIVHSYASWCIDINSPKLPQHFALKIKHKLDFGTH